ncbi:MAG: hypothetical protein ACE5D3_01610, partial [Candidatus Binatia bacterium]
MIGTTIQELAGRARALAGSAGEDYKENRIRSLLKMGAEQFAAEIGFPETSYTWTTVADQSDYTLPHNFLKAIHVTHDGNEMQSVSWKEYQRLTADGQMTSSRKPYHYLLWHNTLKTVPACDVADLDLVLYYTKRPTMRLRDVSGTVASSPTPTTTAFKLAAIQTRYGIVDNGSTTSAYFNDCILEFTDAGDSKKYRSVVSNWNESTEVITVATAFGATPAASDVAQLYDVPEVPLEWSYLLAHYAAGQICRASKEPGERALAVGLLR